MAFHPNKFIDLPALNRERAKLENPQKVTLYATEEVYLATKWALGQTEFEFISLKLAESLNYSME